MFLSLDGTFFVQLINFAIFFAILSVVFLRPVGKAIEKRRAYINSLTQDYDRAQSEATALRTQSDQTRAEARREAEAILARGRAEASNRAADIASEYGRKAQEIIENAHRTVEGEVAAVRPAQDALAFELASNILGKVVPEGRA